VKSGDVSTKHVLKKNVAYRGKHVVKKKKLAFYKAPYVAGVTKKKQTTSSYYKKKVTLTRKAVTTNGTYYKVSYRGQSIGWMKNTVFSRYYKRDFLCEN
jgi:hypothetical protein